MRGSSSNENLGRRDWYVRRMFNDDGRRRNWRDVDEKHRPNDRRNNYRGNYENGRQTNQGYESRNRFNMYNRGINTNDGGYQSRNRGSSENFSRGGRRNRGPSETGQTGLATFD
ncbi:hypothetical protein TNCV_4093161 [Trichonephila clavipes]|nr:hypothetical protein TNCV_4093161 [Trichonephila clavipes]